MYAVAVAENALAQPVLGRDFIEPLEFLLAEHDRQRVLCNTLDAIAANPRHGPGQSDIRAVLDYLEVGLPLHFADEEEDLFPRLALRCTAADPVDDILALLSQEHNMDRGWVEAIKSGLIRLALAQAFEAPEPFFRNTLAFTETHRRHAVWENGVLLPLARKRLRRADLVDMGRGMAKRRGLDYPG